MTQPEQEAREMLAAEWGDHPQFADIRANILDGSCSVHSDTLNLANSIATRALTKALARPTAGIDWNRLTKSLDAIMSICTDRRDVFPDAAAEIEVIAETVNDIYICLINSALDSPSPAKTGEGGAVIEECAAIVELEIRSGYDGDDLTGHERRNFTLRHIAKAIRALSQPLPDTPIVSGEGEES